MHPLTSDVSPQTPDSLSAGGPRLLPDASCRPEVDEHVGHSAARKRNAVVVQKPESFLSLGERT